MLNPADLDRSIAQVEAHLKDLGQALGIGDAVGLEVAADALQRELTTLGSRLRGARGQTLPAGQQVRWRRAEAETRALREALARAAATQARALAALQIATPAEGYGAQGTGLRTGSTGSLVA